MPLRHTQSGWMWGSKGPFPTKAKALQVARGAYAHGYKETIELPKPNKSIVESLSKSNKR
jgi:hypothetical protein